MHKMTGRIDLYARKLREMYIRSGTIASVKQNMDPLRMRRETDRLEDCYLNNELCGVIQARDEFDDVDLVWRVRAAHRVWAADHPWVQPWYVKHPETEEEIRVTCSKIDRHIKSLRPFYIEF